MYLHNLSILIAAQYENCQCSAFKQCTWSSNQLERIGELPKNSTSRLEEVKYFRDRICDFKSKTVYCCKGQTPPLNIGHIEFLKQFSFKPWSPSGSSGTFRASVIEHLVFLWKRT